MSADRIVTQMSADLGTDLWTETSDLTVPDDQNASYTIEVRLSQDDSEPAACFDVSLELLDPDAPELKLATVDARSGACD